MPVYCEDEFGTGHQGNHGTPHFLSNNPAIQGLEIPTLTLYQSLVRVTAFEAVFVPGRQWQVTSVSKID